MTPAHATRRILIAVHATTRRREALVAVLTLAALLVAGPAAPATAEEPIAIPARGSTYAGVYPGAIDLKGVTHDGPVDNHFYDDQVLATFAVGDTKATFAGRFHGVTEADHQADGFNTITPLEFAWRAEATPFSNVVVKASAASIARGDHDAAIARWAGNVKSWLDRGGGRSLIIAPLQEMNGSWVEYGCDPANYKLAYRKFHDAFAALGVGQTQVRWAFAPNGWTSPGCGGLSSYYPGDAYVDVIGISAYNFSGISGSPWSSPYQAMIDPLNELRAFAAHKPVIIAQIASTPTGGDKHQWVRDMFAFTTDDPNVVGFVWFNINKYEGSPAVLAEWAVASGGANGWRDAMQRPTTAYQWPLTDWFQPGEWRVAAAADPKAGSGDPLCGDAAACDSVGLVDEGARFHLWPETHDTAVADSFYFGNPGDYALMGDWDCDGTKTPGQYRQSDGYVYLRNRNDSGVGEIKFFFGDPGDVPIVGDFDGDGCDTVSIYRPNQGQIFIINKLGENDKGLGSAEKSYFFGNPGDKPFVGDFDGDGKDTIGLHRESTGLVYFNNEHRSKSAEKTFVFGDPGDKIVAGDWDGDGDDTPALYRPGDGMVYVKLTNSAGAADHQFYAGPGFLAAVLAPHA